MQFGKKYKYLRRIPLDLLYSYHTKIIKLSLKTNSRREADRIAAIIDERLEKTFADIRLYKLPYSEAKTLVTAALQYNGQSSNEPTLKDLAEEYEKSKGQGWNPKGKQEFWKAHSLVTEAIGNRIVRLVDRALVIQVREHIISKNVQPRTVNKYLQRLSSLLSYAVVCGIIPSNPCVQVKIEVSKKTINEN
ncbi:DUF6538 domain-containing protein, partial [Geobacter sp. OR-1]|uniref:DUF6538 domain-containing protein n=1 Tax=Geobacter sp. OR-1 TaxID=1266765 RepID=UPI001872CCD2